MDIKKLIAVATGEIHHINNGLCPDFQTSPDSRDDECPACKILTDAAAEHDDLERRLREAEARVAELEAERAERAARNPVTAPAVGYVNALRYIAWTAAGYMDCVHAAKRAIGETGALPPPPKTQPPRGEG